MQFSALALYRIGNQLWRWGVPLLPRVFDALNHFLFSASLPHTVPIGEDCSLLHRGLGVVLATDCKVGRGVIIGQFAVIGARVTPQGPVIEDDVIIGAHALVLGDITIGKGAVIAAGAIVVDDVPPGGIMAGPSAELVRITPDGGKEYLASLGAR